MKLSKRAMSVKPSPTLAITAKAKKMKAEGIDVIGFGAGEPDFDTPDYIKDAAKQGLDEGDTKYTPASGTDEFKKAICRKFKKDNGLEFDTSEIIVGCGAKHVLYNVFQAICDEGDEVLIPVPYWVSYPEQVRLAGGTPVFIETDEKNGFRLDPNDIKEAITAKTVAIILNSPSNPTGGVYHKEDLEKIADIAVDANIFVISDEIYEELIYDDAEHVSIASLGSEIKKRTITVNGVSKAYSMTGWRIGYAGADQQLIKAMSKVQGHSTSNPTSFAQRASVVALDSPKDFVEQMRVEFDKRRKYICQRLNSIDGISCMVPGGAFYVFPNVSGLFGRRINGKEIIDSQSLGEILLEEAKVAVVPGNGFGTNSHIRMSYATSMEDISEGLDRLEAVLSKAEA